LFSWTFRIRKVVRQQIWGEVVDYITAFLQFIPKYNSKGIIKIGPQLSELLQKDCLGVFWRNVYSAFLESGPDYRQAVRTSAIQLQYKINWSRSCIVVVLRLYGPLYVVWYVALRTIRTSDYSYPGLFVLWVDYSYLGRFVRWSIRTLDYSYGGLFVPRTIRTMDCSYHM